MNHIIAADDEKYALLELTETLKEACPDYEIDSFRKPAEALEFAARHPVEIAFLDIEMGVMSGLELARRLKNINPRINIIFVTGFSQYALEAFNVEASGYLLKLVTAEQIAKAMNSLRYPAEKKPSEGIEVLTFGNFEVFYKGQGIHFARSKSKELFAYLIYKKGAACSLREIGGILYEDKEWSYSLQSQLQNVISAMLKAFKDIGKGDIILKKYNSISVDISKIDCDYYRFLKGDPEAVNSYGGEFMSNYSWAEFVIGYLDNKTMYRIDT